MRYLGVFAVVAAGVFASGCGPTCQSTCRHVFDPSECDYHPPGIDPEQQIRECAAECNGALDLAGEVADYDPNTPDYTGEVRLENEKQAASWMECVWDRTPDASEDQCDDLAVGYCAPVNF
jgi:hypothetical protein